MIADRREDGGCLLVPTAEYCEEGIKDATPVHGRKMKAEERLTIRIMTGIGYHEERTLAKYIKSMSATFRHAEDCCPSVEQFGNPHCASPPYDCPNQS